MSAATEAGGAVAWMVDCSNTNIAEGDVRFWRAERKYEAHGCALAHGTKAVPLYARPTAPGDDVEALRAEVERLTRERDRLLNFVGFVRVWIHRQTPPNAVNPITDEMRLEAIQHHPMLNDTDACLAGLAQAAAEAALAKARKVIAAVEWHREPMSWAKCPCCGGFQPEQYETYRDYHTNIPKRGLPKLPAGHAPDCALAAALTPTDGGA